jgi:hypothetical protein
MVNGGEYETGEPPVEFATALAAALAPAARAEIGRVSALILELRLLESNSGRRAAASSSV